MERLVVVLLHGNSSSRLLQLRQVDNQLTDMGLTLDLAMIKVMAHPQQQLLLQGSAHSYNTAELHHHRRVMPLLLLRLQEMLRHRRHLIIRHHRHQHEHIWLME